MTVCLLSACLLTACHPACLPALSLIAHPGCFACPLASPILQDYSFLETPELPVDSNSTIIPRRALPNPRIPAFLNGTLVWGTLPAPPAAPSGGEGGRAWAPAAEGAAMAAAALQMDMAVRLPAGIFCEATKDGTGQNCG